MVLICISLFFSFSFGKRSAGSLRRGCECIVLEPSEMIVVSPEYADMQYSVHFDSQTDYCDNMVH